MFDFDLNVSINKSFLFGICAELDIILRFNQLT